jgi:NitT/TauT family transport system permease protein
MPQKKKVPPLIIDVAYPAATILVVLLIWHYLVTLLRFPAYILPSPATIPSEALKNSRLFLNHAWVTFYETAAGLGLSVILAVPLSVLIVWSKTIEKAIMPLVVLSQTFPKTAVAPLFIIWFGFGLLPKIVISFLVAFFPILINTVMGLQSVEPDMLDLIHSLSATQRQVFVKVRLPSAAPYFFGGLKIAITLALIGAIIGEFVGADQGLGYLLIMANTNLDTKLAFAVLAILMLLGAAMYMVISKLEIWICPWHAAMREKGSQGSRVNLTDGR